MVEDKPIARVELRFRDRAALAHIDDPFEEDLSAAARWEDSLFVSCDETASVERLTEIEAGRWGAHRHFALGDLVELPDGGDGEMDIEGLDCDDGWLWVVGSHALKRVKSKKADPAAALEEMAEIKRDANRFFLGRFPLLRGDDGFEPVTEARGRKAAHVRQSQASSRLVNWLDGDAHLGRYLGLPSKENGLDVEGIAARGMRVWLGLRGPVLNGWAVVLELEFELTREGHLRAKQIDGGRRYRKHLLATRGLGVRDLKLDGDDLMVLAGPTLATEGPARVLRWRGGAAERTGGAHPSEATPVALELPFHGMSDHPEGLVRWGEDWLVVCDSPSEARLEGEGAAVIADVWRIP